MNKGSLKLYQGCERVIRRGCRGTLYRAPKRLPVRGVPTRVRNRDMRLRATKAGKHKTPEMKPARLKESAECCLR